MKRRRRQSLIYGIVALVTLAIIFFLLVRFGGDRRTKSYKDPKGRFSIKYPASWTYRENFSGAAVLFYTPQENDLDFFQESVNVVIQDISSKPMGIKEYSQTAIYQMQVVFKENLIIKESEPFTLDGYMGHKFVFIGKGPGTELGYKSVWTLKGATAYQITYTALSTKYEKYLDQVDRMIKSFRLLQ